jgi:hypothetical protein
MRMGGGWTCHGGWCCGRPRRTPARSPRGSVTCLTSNRDVEARPAGDTLSLAGCTLPTVVDEVTTAVDTRMVASHLHDASSHETQLTSTKDTP